METRSTLRRLSENLQNTSKSLMKEALIRSPIPLNRIGKRRIKKMISKAVKGPTLYYILGGLGAFILGRYVYNNIKSGKLKGSLTMNNLPN